MNEIFHRVSIRKYEDRPVEHEKLMKILRAGMQAPSAGDQQPWEFYIVTRPECIRALSKSHIYAGCAAEAPVLIVSVYRKEGLWVPEYAQIDMAIAQENMWLETDALGLGGVWLGIAPIRERMDTVAQILNLLHFRPWHFWHFSEKSTLSHFPNKAKKFHMGVTTLIRP